MLVLAKRLEKMKRMQSILENKARVDKFNNLGSTIYDLLSRRKKSSKNEMENINHKESIPFTINNAVIILSLLENNDDIVRVKCKNVSLD